MGERQLMCIARALLRHCKVRQSGGWQRRGSAEAQEDGRIASACGIRSKGILISEPSGTFFFLVALNLCCCAWVWASHCGGLKLNIQKTKIMASGPITSWKIDGETMESDRLYFLGLQNHCRW